MRCNVSGKDFVKRKVLRPVENAMINATSDPGSQNDDGEELGGDDGPD